MADTKIANESTQNVLSTPTSNQLNTVRPADPHGALATSREQETF